MKYMELNMYLLNVQKWENVVYEKPDWHVRHWKFRLDDNSLAVTN